MSGEEEEAAENCFAALSLVSSSLSSHLSLWSDRRRGRDEVQAGEADQ